MKRICWYYWLELYYRGMRSRKSRGHPASGLSALRRRLCTEASANASASTSATARRAEFRQHLQRNHI